MRDFLLNFLLHMKQVRLRGEAARLARRNARRGAHACGGARPAIGSPSRLRRVASRSAPPLR
jgi:hypothetical protein